MGLYDGIKDVAKIVQQADNIDLYRKLIDLSAQALDMQSEIQRLSEENRRLVLLIETASDIERHPEQFITKTSDKQLLRYCAHCWDVDKKMVQLNCSDNGSFYCPHCKNKGLFDVAKYRSTRTASIGVISRGIGR